MANPCCSSTDHVKNDPPCQQNITMEHISFCSAKNIGFEKCAPCRKITSSSTRTAYCDVKDHQGPSSEALPLECAPCCEVITSQTRTDYRPTDKGIECEKDRKIKKCVPCREIVTNVETITYCDIEEKEENCHEKSEKCNPCCEVVTTKKRIDYLTEKNGKSAENCVPCLNTSGGDDRVVYCNGKEASDQGCTPCYEVITTKKIVDYDSKEASSGKKIIKKCVPCYEVTCCCKTILYCDQNENQTSDVTFHKNCSPCCKEETVQKRISYTPNATGFDGPNLDSLSLMGCC